MMLGMLKDLGNKLVSDQSKTWHQRESALTFLPQDVLDHLLLEKRREREKAAKKAPRVATASVLV